MCQQALSRGHINCLNKLTVTIQLTSDMKGRQTELQLRINRDRKTPAMQTDTGHCQTQGICDSLDDGKQRDSEREGED